MKRMNTAAVPAEVMAIKQLPPLSTTATELLQVVGDPDVELETIAAIIERDPALTARILGLANSAYFGQSCPIHRVEQAIIRVLGLNLVKGLSMSIALAGSFDTTACPGFDMANYWHRTLGTAILGRLIAQRVNSEFVLDADGVYLSGLLLRIGLLLLAHVLPQPLSEALEAWDRTGDEDLPAMERRFLDTDHIQAGEWLARRWHLPRMVCSVIAHRADDGYAGQYDAELCIVRGADQWLEGQMSERSLKLAEVPCLLQVPGLDADSLENIERRFGDRMDELQTLARALV